MWLCAQACVPVCAQTAWTCVHVRVYPRARVCAEVHGMCLTLHRECTSGVCFFCLWVCVCVCACVAQWLWMWTYRPALCKVPALPLPCMTCSSHFKRPSLARLVCSREVITESFHGDAEIANTGIEPMCIKHLDQQLVQDEPSVNAGCHYCCCRRPRDRYSKSSWKSVTHPCPGRGLWRALARPSAAGEEGSCSCV